MTLAVFHDFPGLENGLTKFHDFPGRVVCTPHKQRVTFIDRIISALTTADALVLAGDVNIRLERSSDPATTEFCDLIAGYGLTQHVTGPTHDAGGTLDVVCTRTDLPTPTVDIIDPGLSDHRLLLWTTSLQRPPPVYSKSTRRA